jgi:hypothetical protein
MLFIPREHLRAYPEAEAKLRNAGGRSEPASRGGRGHHIAEPINNVEMDRVVFGLAHPAYGWLTGAARADHRPIAPDPRLEHFSVPRNSAGSLMKRCTLGDKDLTLSVIGVRRQDLDRRGQEWDRRKRYHGPRGKLRGFDLPMNEIGSHRVRSSN